MLSIKTFAPLGEENREIFPEFVVVIVGVVVVEIFSTDTDVLDTSGVCVEVAAEVRNARRCVIKRSFIRSASVLLRYAWFDGGNQTITYPLPYGVYAKAGSPLSNDSNDVAPCRRTYISPDNIIV